MAFRGRYEHSLDTKDRLTVPAKFRAALSAGVVLAAGLDPCVWVYPTAAYEEFAERFLGGINPLGGKGRMLNRHFHGNAYDEKLDSAGRIRLPKQLIDHAGLTGSCVIVGMHGYLEIWDEKKWSSYEKDMKDTVVDAAENVARGD